MTTTLEQAVQAQNLLGLGDLVTLEGLRESWFVAQQRLPRPGPDGVTVQKYAHALEANLHAVFAAVQTGDYRPKPAYRVWLAKPSGGEREVVALCLEDRIVQGAVLRTLGRRLSSTMSHSSFAYREGLGALRAAHRVLEQRDAGRIWVVRGDIENCFDSIPHQGVLELLAGHLEASAVALIARLLQTPVRDGKSQSVPEIGLPQGALISPLLANLYLTAFDRAVDQAPAALVRFADDFALLAPTAGGVGACLERGEAILEQLRLQLNAKKTRIVSFEQGFDFLGFHFQRRDVRVAPERVLEFKAHLEHLCAPRIGNPQPGHIKQANDAVRGWRAYFRLGNIREDFVLLEQWMRDRFGKTADLLERLTVADLQVRAPELGGYAPRGRKTEPSPRAAQPKPALKRVAPLNHPSLTATRDPSGLPLVVLGRRVSDYGHVCVPEPIQRQLERAALYHRAVACNRWNGEVSAEATVQLTLAARGLRPADQAKTLYEQALSTQASTDLRAARGQLRRFVRLEAWTALLLAGWELGLEETGALPRLAVLLGDAFEGLTVDVALLTAARSASLHKPLPLLEQRLAQTVKFRGQRVTWREVLHTEGELLRQTDWRCWLWGTA